ncbi:MULTISPECIES: hypothetical protein [Pseudanabaena]|uniref:hypothetical protein n=1 Tax=Pseudanabaena TaxID=1152 RepID=UPI0024783D58|nr:MULTISPECIES: hypothetical protein [Pseudanabaena]MEA5489566.1 hypothetical protein [Pseudanabaena sp. CCNP1317]WGS73722.1 hypothetical protein OA858_06730 [Pseudanabaena galeata CCNP1313]
MFLLRKISIRLSVLLLSAIATGLFNACGNSENGNNFSMPANDTTKVSPTPTPTNTNTTTATPASTSVPTSSPKPAIAPSTLPELEIKELEPYKHRSGILEMDVPKGWKLIDKSQTGELLVTWNEQAGRATISTNIFVPPSEIPENRLSDVFAVMIKGMYGDQTDFEMRSPVVESTGNIVIVWTSTVTIGGQQIKFQANSKLQRRNNKLAILTFGAIEPRFTQLKDYFFRISNNQVINAELAIP